MNKLVDAPLIAIGLLLAAFPELDAGATSVDLGPQYEVREGLPATPIDPYYPNLATPRLTTPMWFGEPGVEAVVLLSIDDMRDPEKYEAYLRPILDRLKAIDGRAPLSIFTNVVPPNHPQLQTWLAEGLSFEAHTRDHPCPLLGGKPLSWSKESYDACVDLLHAIPGNEPVAFRMPCCDSKNTLSPRFFSEIFFQPTPGQNHLQIDTSVFNITTSDDPALPRDLVLDSDGREKFRKYVPFPSYVNTIENHPYPYLIGNRCWEFPCTVPSDWEAQNINGVNAQQSVDDMKAALDVAIIKQGVYTLVFHPHGWIQNTQVVELIDHAVEKHGNKVKFITFREAAEKLELSTAAQEYTSSMTRHRQLPADIDGDGNLDDVTAWNGNIIQLNDLTPKGFSWPNAPGAPTLFEFHKGDQGLRLIDIDGDGDLDFIYSNDEAYGLLLFEGADKGWSTVVKAGYRADAVDDGVWPLPPFVSKGENRGAWFHSGHIWWQNEDTANLPDHVDRRAFKDLLREVQAEPSPSSQSSR